MKTFAFLLLLLSGPAFAVNTPPAEPSPCEIQMSRPARVVVQSIKSALSAGIIAKGDLEEFLKTGKWLDPSLAQVKSVGNVHFRGGIAKAMRQVGESDRPRVFEAVGRILDTEAAKSQTVNIASEATKSILLPQFLGPMGEGELGTLSGTFHSGHFEGRPVLMAVYFESLPERLYKLMLIDPFHADPEKRVRKIMSENFWAWKKVPVFVERNGRTYAALIWWNVAYDLSDGKKVSLRDIGLSALEADEETKNKIYGYVTAKTGQGQLLAVQHWEKTQIYNLDHEEISLVLEIQKGFQTLQFVRAGDRDFLIGDRENTHFMVRDLTTRKINLLIEGSSGGHLRHGMTVFEEQGHYYLALGYLAPGAEGDQWAVRRLDLETGDWLVMQDELTRKISGSKKHVMGSPFFVTTANGTSILNDARTMSSQLIGQNESLPWTSFIWRKDRYLIAGNHVLEANRPEVAIPIPGIVSYSESQTLEYRDDIYLIVQKDENYPNLLKLTRKSSY